MQVLQIFGPYFGLELFTHREMHKQRADLISVMHSHSPSVIAFGLVRMPTTQ